LTDSISKDPPRRGRKELVEVRDLRVWFPVHAGVLLRHVGDVKAVDGVTFTIREGETLGLVGESGCGKTTAGKAILGLTPVQSGKILLHGESSSPRDLVGLSRREMRPIRADISMIYQDPYSSLNPRWSIRDIVAEPWLVHRRYISAAERDERVGWLLEKVGLTAEQADRYPHEFSGGQRQRVGIARALATNPRLVIADEPVSALDVSIQAQVLNLMQDLQEEFGLAYLFIAHDLSVVEHISHRVAVMYLGNIVELATPRDLYRDPIHPYTRALLSAVPIPDPTVIRPDRIVLEGEVPSPQAKPSGCAFRTRCPLAEKSCAEAIPALLEVAPERWAACPVATR
jgi:oligopeptide transport system ATP-binding protein